MQRKPTAHMCALSLGCQPTSTDGVAQPKGMYLSKVSLYTPYTSTRTVVRAYLASLRLRESSRLKDRARLSSLRSVLDGSLCRNREFLGAQQAGRDPSRALGPTILPRRLKLRGE